MSIRPVIISMRKSYDIVFDVNGLHHRLSKSESGEPFPTIPLLTLTGMVLPSRRETVMISTQSLVKSRHGTSTAMAMATGIPAVRKTLVIALKAMWIMTKTATTVARASFRAMHEKRAIFAWSMQTVTATVPPIHRSVRILAQTATTAIRLFILVETRSRETFVSSTAMETAMVTLSHPCLMSLAPTAMMQMIHQP